MGKPAEDNQHKFVPIKIQGVTIWKPASVEADESKEGIQIRLSKFFIFKSLSIDGAKITKSCEELEGNS